MSAPVFPATGPVPATATRPIASPPSDRLVSLDALRGFDMFWILGGDAVMQILGGATTIRPLQFLAGQFEHKEWAGFAFYDLIFPLFVFMVGVSTVFSLSRTIDRDGRGAAVKRVLLRFALLFALGLFYSGGVSNRWPDIRLLGVLQRIALAYLGAGLLFCWLKPRGLAWATVGLLAGYWALLTFVPIRDFQLDKSAVIARVGLEKPALEQVRAAYAATTHTVTGRYEPGLNVSNHFDFEHLPGRNYDVYWDPEGLVSTLPAIATCLLGVLAGFILRRADWSSGRKLNVLLIAGAVSVALGWAWHFQFPVVKKIWTSSFVLVAGGWSALLLAAFYYVVDVRRWRAVFQPFVWIGMNAITLYLAANIVGPRRLAQRVAGGDVKAFLDTHLGARSGDLLIALVGLGFVLLLARFLYRRQIFLRV